MSNAADPTSLELYLLEGRYDGPIRISQRNTKLRLYIFPRTSLAKYRGQEDIELPGLYILVGDRSRPRPEVYIGQADRRQKDDKTPATGTRGRVVEHFKAGRYSWCETALLLVNEDFDGADLKWLEHNFYELSLKSGYGDIKNQNEPQAGHRRSSSEQFHKEITEQARLWIATMGYPIFEPPLASSSEPSRTAENTLNMETEPSRGPNSPDFYRKLKGVPTPALMTRSAGRWVLKSGSPVKLRDAVNDEQASRLRQAYAKEIKDGFIVTDIAFESANEAARFVAGSAVNSNRYWKRVGDGAWLGAVRKTGEV